MKQSDNWLQLVTFCDIHGVDAAHVSKYVAEGRLPKVAFKYLPDGDVYVNERWFTRRADFIQKVYVRSHDMYYELLEYTGTEYNLAKVLTQLDCQVSPLSSWSTFVARDMWKLRSTTILSYKVHDLAYKFYRYATWLLRIYKRRGIPKKKEM